MLVTGGAGFIGSNFVRSALDNAPDLQLVNGSRPKGVARNQEDRLARLDKFSRNLTNRRGLAHPVDSDHHDHKGSRVRQNQLCRAVKTSPQWALNPLILVSGRCLASDIRFGKSLSLTVGDVVEEQDNLVNPEDRY